MTGTRLLAVFTLLILLSPAAPAAGRKSAAVVPEAPDYTDATMWFTADGDPDGTGADVFYLVSTWEEDWTDAQGRVCHYADVWNPEHRERMGREISGVAAYMAPGNRFWAPYYRHTTIETFMTRDEAVIHDRTRLSMSDVCAAFDTFLRTRDSSRPLILAGFSQGGLAVVELLKHMDDETYAQLAAAYVMGYKVTAEDLAETPHIRAAQGASDTGVTICYNTVKDVKYVNPVIAGTRFGINPVNWTTDDTPATLHDSITVVLSPAYHVLVVSGYDGADYKPYKGFLNVGDIHSCEPWLYSECIRENIGVRARSWRAANDPARPSIRTEQLEGVSVSGSRVPLSLNQSARMVTVLDTLQIRSAPVQTVNDLLKYAVGVDVRQRGAMGVQTDIGIRGGSFDQIAVLLNGINISDPQTGHLAMDLPVDLGEIDRIEILEGPAGRVYGTSSLVGAINIVTRTEERSGADIRLEGGSFGSFSAGIRAGLATGRWNNQVSASYGRSDGYSRNAAGRLNADFRTVKAFYQGGYDSPRTQLRWHLGLSAKDYGANTFYSARYDDQFEHGLKTFAALQAETRGRLHFQPKLYWNHSDDRFELFRGDESRVPFNYHRTDVLGANLGGWFDSPLGKTAFGTELRREGILSTTLGEALEQGRAIRGTERDYTRGLKRTHLSFYLEHNVVLQRFTASAGLAAVRNTGIDMPFQFYPGADLSVRIGRYWKAYASANSSLRMPTFTELYYSVGGHAADKQLRPERMQAYELGIKYLHSGISAVASLYHHRGRDMIDWIKDLSQGEDALWTSVNHTRINTLGEELSLRLSPGILLGRPDFFVRSFNAAYSHIRQDKQLEAQLQSRYAMEYLRHKLVLQADFRLGSKLSLDLSYRWQDRVGNYEAFADGVSQGTVAYKPYSLLDARLSWESGDWTLFLDGNNLLNRIYYDHGNIPQPGCWLRGGILFRIR